MLRGAIWSRGGHVRLRPRWRWHCSAGRGFRGTLRTLNPLAIDQDKEAEDLAVKDYIVVNIQSDLVDLATNVPADIASRGQSGKSVSGCAQLSLNLNASGIVSHSVTSLSVNSSIFCTFIKRSLLRIWRARIVNWSTNSLSRRIVGSVVRGSGGGQSPIPDMPSGRPSVTEYCWSM